MIDKLFSAAHYHHAEQRVIESILSRLSPNRGVKLLDVGCGRGAFAPLLARLGFDFYGVDSSSDMIDLARKNGHNAMSIQELDASGQKFDVVLISHVVEHLHFKDLYEFMQHYIKKLSPGGTLILATPLLGSNFYFDFTHERPYYPQAIWQVFGNYKDSLSIQKRESLRLVDIYFVRDSFRTREWRSYYVRENYPMYLMTRVWNGILASAYLLSGFRIGPKVSWIGVYSLIES